MKQKVLFLLLDEFILLDVVGPLQVFSLADEILIERGGLAAYKAGMHVMDGRTGVGMGSVGLNVEPLPPLVPFLGTLFVVGGSKGSSKTMLENRRHQRAQAWVRGNAQRFTRVASVGKDAFLLMHSVRTGTASPSPPRAEATIGHRGRPVLAGSVAPPMQMQRWMSVNAKAGLEVALAMVRNDLGEAVAVDIASRLAEAYGQRLLLRLGGSLSSEADGDRRLDALHGWMEEHLCEKLPVARLAARLTMTPRTFARYYLRSTGTTPAQAVLQLRLERACMLIASSPTLTLKAISHQCGFSSEEVMRRTFLRALRMSPRSYREQVANAPPHDR